MVNLTWGFGMGRTSMTTMRSATLSFSACVLLLLSHDNVLIFLLLVGFKIAHFHPHQIGTPPTFFDEVRIFWEYDSTLMSTPRGPLGIAQVFDDKQ